jgi:hypothetical protein
MLSYDNDLPLPVLVPMKTSFPSAKALKLSLGMIFMELVNFAPKKVSNHIDVH